MKRLSLTVASAVMLALSVPAVAKAEPEWHRYRDRYLQQNMPAVDNAKLISVLTRQALRQWRPLYRDWLVEQQAAEAALVTTILPEPEPEPPAPEPAPVPEPEPAPVVEDVWWSLALCESSGKQDAFNPDGPFYGYFQFMWGTWQSLSTVPDGDPRSFPYEVQLRGAKENQARSGWGQWPHCASTLGLY